MGDFRLNNINRGLDNNNNNELLVVGNPPTEVGNHRGIVFHLLHNARHININVANTRLLTAVTKFQRSGPVNTVDLVKCVVAVVLLTIECFELYQQSVEGPSYSRTGIGLIAGFSCLLLR